MQFSSLLSWHFAYSNKRKDPELRNGKVRLATWPFASFLSRHFAYPNERKKPRFRNGKVRLRTWPFASYFPGTSPTITKERNPNCETKKKTTLQTLHSPPRKIKSPTTKCFEQPQHEPSATLVCCRNVLLFSAMCHNTEHAQQFPRGLEAHDRS